MAARLSLLFLLLATAVSMISAGEARRQFLSLHAGSTHFQENRQTNSSPAPQTNDLSGAYVGILDYPTAGLSGVAMLTIYGDNFTLNIESRKLSGRINPAAAGDYTRVIMVFEPPLAGSASVISLSASRNGNRLRLSSLPGENVYFRFGDQGSQAADRTMGQRSGRMGDVSGAIPNAKRGPASVEYPTLTNARRGPASVKSASANVANAKRGPASVEGPPANLNRSTARNKGPSKDPSPSGRDIARRVRATGPSISNTTSMADSNRNSNVNSSMDSNDTVHSQLRGNANVAFTTPESMQFTEIRDIELRVSPSESSEALARSLSEPGTAGKGSTEFADRMEAQLVGSGFTIISACPEIQPVEAGRTTWWKWQIKPKEAGPQRLDLTLNAVLNNGKDKSMLQTFHREIRIEVTWRQRASSIIIGLKDIQWLWAAIILPISVAFYGWWRKRRGQEDGAG